MDQIVDNETLDRMLSAMQYYDANIPGVNTSLNFRNQADHVKLNWKNLTLNDIHEIIRELNCCATLKSALSSIILCAALKNQIDLISKQGNEINSMKEEILTLNEKMAVLIDALSTLTSINN